MDDLSRSPPTGLVYHPAHACRRATKLRDLRGLQWLVEPSLQPGASECDVLSARLRRKLAAQTLGADEFYGGLLLFDQSTLLHNYTVQALSHAPQTM